MPAYRSSRLQHLLWIFDDTVSSSDSYRLAGGGVFNYMGLCTAAPNDNGTMANESTVTTRSATFSKASTADYEFGVVNNKTTYRHKAAITWSAATGSATLTHWFGAPSATTGTNHQCYYQFPYPINVTSGDVVRFDVLRLAWSIPMLTTAYAQNFFEYLVDLDTSMPTWTSGYTWSIGLSTTTPNADGTNFTEPAVGGYARETLSSSWSGSGYDGDNAYIDNTGSQGQFVFATATAQWPTVTHWGFFAPTTAPHTGQLQAFGELDSPVTVLTGETPRFIKGDWRVESGI